MIITFFIFKILIIKYLDKKIKFITFYTLLINYSKNKNVPRETFYPITEFKVLGKKPWKIRNKPKITKKILIPCFIL